MLHAVRIVSRCLVTACMHLRTSIAGLLCYIIHTGSSLQLAGVSVVSLSPAYTNWTYM